MSKGDTFAVVCEYNNRFRQAFAKVIVSSNRGRSWTPAHCFIDTNSSHHGSRPVLGIITSQGVFVNEYNETSDTLRLYYSTNNGISWQRSQNQSGYGFGVRCSQGDTLAGSNFFNRIQTPVWTVDRGETYFPPFPTDTLDAGDEFSLNAGQMLIAGRSTSNQVKVYYKPVSSTTFQRAIIPHDTYPDLDNALIKHNHDGYGVLAIDASNSVLSSLTILVSHTTDFGRSWSDFDTISHINMSSLAGGRPSYLGNQGKLFALCWYDRHPYLPESLEGGYMVSSITANNGRSWYFPQDMLIEVDSAGSELTQIEFRGDSIFYNYMVSVNVNMVNTYGFRSACVRISGCINRDTIVPVINEPMVLPLTISRLQPISLAARFSDNDSVWQTQCIIRRSGDLDSAIIALTRNNTDNLYHGNWTPSDTGNYQYYYRCEDMWENVSRLPTNAMYQTRVLPVENVDHTVPMVLTEAMLRVFPNPVNGMITFTGQLPAHSSNTQLKIYNLTGALVASLPIKPNAIGSYRASWDCRNAQGSTVASGVYFAQLNTSMKASLVRFSVIK